MFNGTNTYAYTDNITLSDNFTVAFWTKPNSPKHGLNGIQPYLQETQQIVEDFKLILILLIMGVYDFVAGPCSMINNLEFKLMESYSNNKNAW